MPRGSRWSNTEFRTPDGMSYDEWRASDEYLRARKEYDRKRYAAKKYPHREKAAAWDNTIGGRASRLMGCARVRAKKKGLDLAITQEWIEHRLAKGSCEVTGLSFVYVRGERRKHPHSPSIDRIDNSLGYTPDNCRVVVWALNAALADFGMDTYLEVAKRVIARGGQH